MMLTSIALYTLVEAHFVSVFMGRNYALFLMGSYWIGLVRRNVPEGRKMVGAKASGTKTSGMKTIGTKMAGAQADGGCQVREDYIWRGWRLLSRA